MRVRLSGDGPGAGRVAAALLAGGFQLAAEEDPCDLLVTLAEAASGAAGGAGLMIDLARRRASLRHQRLRLTPIEFALLGYLARARRPVSRAELLRELWGHRFDPGTNSVAVHVSRLRGKLGREAIATAGDGYALALEVEMVENAPLR